LTGNEIARAVRAGIRRVASRLRENGEGGQETGGEYGKFEIMHELSPSVRRTGT